MFDDLSTRLSGIFRKLRGAGKLTASDVRETMTEVRRALLAADVHVRVAKDFVRRVEERSVGEEVLESLTPGQAVIGIVHDELVRLLAGGADGETGRGVEGFELPPGPATVLLAGLQGSGKTTLAAKLAYRYKRAGRRPYLVPLDTRRPAAREQLRTLAERIGVPAGDFEPSETPPAIARREAEAARSAGRDLVILDTAGRLQTDQELLDEVREVHTAAGGGPVLLALDVTIGQEAVSVAEAFGAALPVSGVVFTKLDGDARGGAALSVAAQGRWPVVFVGTGEKPEDLEVFHPDRMASRILGMGDVVSLVEKARDVQSEADMARQAERLLEGRFTFDDFLGQLEQLRKMGPLENLLGMIPGMPAGAAAGGLDTAWFGRAEAIVRSMTRAERERPEVIDASRRRRIAQGSGTRLSDVNRLLTEFEQMRGLVAMAGGLGRKAGGLGRKGGLLNIPAGLGGPAGGIPGMPRIGGVRSSRSAAGGSRRRASGGAKAKKSKKRGGKKRR